MKPIAALDAQSKSQEERLFFLDCLKAISILAVVSYHSIFIPSETYQAGEFWVTTAFAPLRFCVPIFLTISFFLSERSLSRKPGSSGFPQLQRRLTRLAIPALFWVTLATALKLLNGGDPLDLLNQIFVGEIFYGAYYFLILFQLTPLFFAVRRYLHRPLILNGIVALQLAVFMGVLMVLANPQWAEVNYLLEFFRRPPFIYWFIYPVLGFYCYQQLPWIVQQSQRLYWPEKALLLVANSLVLTLEYAFLDRITAGSVQPFEYLMVSCITSIPVMFICFAAISPEDLPKPLLGLVMKFSKYSLGVFCINGLLSHIFLSLGSNLGQDLVLTGSEILVIKLVGWIGLAGLSLGLSMLLDRIGLKAVVC